MKESHSYPLVKGIGRYRTITITCSGGKEEMRALRKGYGGFEKMTPDNQNARGKRPVLG